MKYTVCNSLENKKEYNGKINYKSLKNLLEEVKPFDEIFLLDDEYYGKFYIKTPNLRIVGNENYSNLTYDAYHGLIIRNVDGGDGTKVYGTTGSASVTVLEEATNLVMEHLTISNSYIRKIGDEGTQNVAFKTCALNGLYKDIRFIGNQDTLYIDESNNVFDNCYIEGDVDFIFGSGDAIIKNSTCKMLKVLNSNAYLCAPDTYIDNKYGFVFYNCKVLSVPGNLKYLGRAWYPSGAKREVCPRVMFMNCSFDEDIDLRLITMHEGDPTTFKYYLKDCKKNNEIISNYYDSNIDSYYLNYIKEQ